MAMNPTPPETNQPGAHEIVRFLVDAGVDAIVGDAPVNRLAAAPESPRAPPAMAAPGRVPASSASAAPEADARLRAEAANAQTLDELRALMEAYEGCALKKTATQLVFADGTPGARIMLVGEAPGRDEDLQGKPFVGRSGQMLDRMLAAIGLDRTSVYIANTVPWRPPGNRPPTPEETEQCRPFILRQIALAAPQMLVLVGGQAAKAILNAPTGIMQMRGNWVDAEISESLSLPALPTLHPAYLLRNPAHKRLAWSDMLALKRRLDAMA